MAPEEAVYASIQIGCHGGNSGVLELSISALVFPFIETVMRVSPFILRMLRKYL